jgi:hypothetical protein
VRLRARPIGSFAKIVDARNQAAHSNGNISFNSQKAIDDKIGEVMPHIEEIQTLSKPIVDDCLIEFLKSSWNPDEREYLDDEEQFREALIHKNYLSQKDIELMLKFDIARLSSEDHFDEIKQLFDKFALAYKAEEVL